MPVLPIDLRYAMATVQAGGGIQTTRFSEMLQMAPANVSLWRANSGRPPRYALILLRLMMAYDLKAPDVENMIGVPWGTLEERQAWMCVPRDGGAGGEAWRKYERDIQEAQRRVMGPAEYAGLVRSMESYGWTHERVAALMEKSPRQAARWRLGGSKVPRGVILVLAIAKAWQLTPEAVERITADKVDEVEEQEVEDAV